MQRYGFGLLLGLMEGKMDKNEDFKADFIVMKSIGNWKFIDYNETIKRIKLVKSGENIKKVLKNVKKIKKS